MSTKLKMDLYLKKDYLLNVQRQSSGYFKDRGSRYTIIKLSPENKKKGVITTSAGNHAQALAWHGRDLGVPVTVCMPSIAPQVNH